jgi:hypothetical protein
MDEVSQHKSVSELLDAELDQVVGGSDPASEALATIFSHLG